MFIIVWFVDVCYIASHTYSVAKVVSDLWDRFEPYRAHIIRSTIIICDEI